MAAYINSRNQHRNLQRHLQAELNSDKPSESRRDTTTTTGTSSTLKLLPNKPSKPILAGSIEVWAAFAVVQVIVSQYLCWCFWQQCNIINGPAGLADNDPVSVLFTQNNPDRSRVIPWSDPSPLSLCTVYRPGCSSYLVLVNSECSCLDVPTWALDQWQMHTDSW